MKPKLILAQLKGNLKFSKIIIKIYSHTDEKATEDND